MKNISRFRSGEINSLFNVRIFQLIAHIGNLTVLRKFIAHLEVNNFEMLLLRYELTAQVCSNKPRHRKSQAHLIIGKSMHFYCASFLQGLSRSGRSLRKALLRPKCSKRKPQNHPKIKHPTLAVLKSWG